MTGLRSGVAYRVCVVGRSALVLQRQVTVLLLTTKDVVAPGLRVQIVPGSSSVTPGTSPPTCKFALTTQMNETGSIAYAVVPSSVSVANVTTRLLYADDGIGFKPLNNGTWDVMSDDVDKNVTHAFSEMPCDEGLQVLVAARDTFGNIREPPVQVAVRTPDAKAPGFTTTRMSNITSTAATLQVALDEPGVVWYLLKEGPAAKSCPSSAELKAENASTLNVSQQNVALALEFQGLLTMQPYFVCLVAADKFNNVQTLVTRIEFNTTDAQKPDLEATIADKSVRKDAVGDTTLTLTLSTKLTEAGSVAYILALDTSSISTVAASDVFDALSYVGMGSLPKSIRNATILVQDANVTVRTSVTGVPCDNRLVLIIAGKDASGNCAEPAILLKLLTPPCQAPLFQLGTPSVTNISATSVTVALALSVTGQAGCVVEKCSVDNDPWCAQRAPLPSVVSILGSSTVSVNTALQPVLQTIPLTQVCLGSCLMNARILSCTFYQFDGCLIYSCYPIYLIVSTKSVCQRDNTGCA